MEAISSRGSKAHIDTIGSDLQIRVKLPIDWFVLIFMSVWLFFWTIGELVVLNILFGIVWPVPFDVDVFGFDFGEIIGTGGLVLAFLLIWLLFWTRAGIRAFRALLTMLAGSELIEVNSGGITLSRQIFGMINMCFPLRIFILEEKMDIRILFS